MRADAKTTFAYFIGVIWLIGKSGASDAADLGSNLGDGELLSNK